MMQMLDTPIYYSKCKSVLNIQCQCFENFSMFGFYFLSVKCIIQYSPCQYLLSLREEIWSNYCWALSWSVEMSPDLTTEQEANHQARRLLTMSRDLTWRDLTWCDETWSYVTWRDVTWQDHGGIPVWSHGILSSLAEYWLGSGIILPGERENYS